MTYECFPSGESLMKSFYETQYYVLLQPHCLCRIEDIPPLYPLCMGGKCFVYFVPLQQDRVTFKDIVTD